MTWENQEPENPNLEALRQEFGLENIRNSTILTTAPTVNELGPGQFALVFLDPNLFLYSRQNDDIFRLQFTKI